MAMRSRILSIWSLFLIPSACSAQVLMEGEVTFITSNNVYVNFETTDGIAVGDTLQLVKGEVVSPCLLVSSKSSISCVCKVINECKVEKKDRITFSSAHRSGAADGGGPIDDAVPGDSSAIDDGRKSNERIRGRISAASYSTIASEREDDHRVMYRLSLDADHINNSKFSAQTYLNYRQLFPAHEGTYPQRTAYFNVYDLAVTYEPDTTLSLTLGRKINNNASSIGAIDGLQVEKYFGDFFAGAIAGSRPDFETYGLNLDLLEYGGYVGAHVSTAHVESRSTLGLLQQTNAGQVDRRYTYFQHSSTINRNLNIFSSFELDLYNQLNGDIRLTNLYVASRYRFSRKVDVFASYDSRKRIVYYETYKNDVETLLDDDEARQGARIRLNVKPIKEVSMGVSFSKRFQLSGQNPSDNINGYVNFSTNPAVWGRWSIQVNRNTSSYMRSDIASIRHSRALIKKKLNASLYYRIAEYFYSGQGSGEAAPVKIEQNYYGVDLAYDIGAKFVFTVLGEMSTFDTEQNYRVNASITKRFDSRRR